MEQHSNPFQEYQSVESAVEWQDTAIDPAEKAKRERRFQRGAIWMCVGAFMLLLSFGINLVMFQKMDFSTLMYVMVSLGALCVLKGMGNVFN